MLMTSLTKLTYYITELHVYHLSIFIFFMTIKVKDGCSQGQHNCHVSATCQNTVGSFNCACLPGEISDGIACASKKVDF